jgi:hypothetical protein
LEYDAGLMRNRILGAHEINEQNYADDLEHIKKRIDWCIRKSLGENPDIDDYCGYK